MKIIPSSKKNRYIARVVIVLAAIALIVWLVSWLSAPFAGGSGTEENPYQIANWRHLNNVRDYLDDCFILMNDLDSTTAGYDELASPTANGGKGWEPIGVLHPEISLKTFNGIFEGQGHEIHNLFIDRPYYRLVGLFFSIGAEGTIKNVGIVDATVIGERPVGCLAGSIRGTVSDCYASGKVTGKNYVGGLVGANEGIVFNSYFTGNVIGEGQVGGLMGHSHRGTVSNSYSTGNVIGLRTVGGLVGWNYIGDVFNCYFIGNVTGGRDVGGLVGDHNKGTVSNCYSNGKVTGGSSVQRTILTRKRPFFIKQSPRPATSGGLVGDSEEGTVDNSFWNTQTSGRATSDGGIGKTTTEMQDISTFSGVGWDIIGVANSSIRNLSYIWNIVDDETYPFLSWQPV